MSDRFFFDGRFFGKGRDMAAAMVAFFAQDSLWTAEEVAEDWHTLLGDMSLEFEMTKTQRRILDIEITGGLNADHVIDAMNQFY